MTETWQELLEVASEAAAAGGEALASHWGQLRQIRSKGRLGDLVTEADLAEEAKVLAVLQQNLTYPNSENMARNSERL